MLRRLSLDMPSDEAGVLPARAQWRDCCMRRGGVAMERAMAAIATRLGDRGLGARSNCTAESRPARLQGRSGYRRIGRQAGGRGARCLNGRGVQRQSSCVQGSGRASSVGSARSILRMLCSQSTCAASAVWSPFSGPWAGRAQWHVVADSACRLREVAAERSVRGGFCAEQRVGAEL